MAVRSTYVVYVYNPNYPSMFYTALCIEWLIYGNCIQNNGVALQKKRETHRCNIVVQNGVPIYFCHVYNKLIEQNFDHNSQFFFGYDIKICDINHWTFRYIQSITNRSSDINYKGNPIHLKPNAAEKKNISHISGDSRVRYKSKIVEFITIESFWN